ncbi:hypothetical protein D9619_004604 [Psilocybe cf. subviscida]|uniref:Uncharacterized protein n=1 Tax=Psilocybe cf. subviscida TaxID=2480587 RepID=A0A8H5BP99_9AGAR|nr:hypothetical protein D9619_004604 [Psilocybe cf. subviscida]
MPRETTELFLPGRKIKASWWTRQYEDIEMDPQTRSMQHPAKDLSTVEYMEYDEAAENPPFALMIHYLPNVKLLKTHFHSKELCLKGCPSFAF